MMLFDVTKTNEIFVWIDKEEREKAGYDFSNTCSKVAVLFLLICIPQ